MHYKSIIATALFCVCSIPCFAGSITYSALTDKTNIKSEWEKQVKENKLFISGSSSVKTISIECTPTFEVERFTQKEASGKEFSVSRSNNKLKVSGTVNGKEKTKDFEIGASPWVQEFKFGFQPFLCSDKKEYKFYIVNPKDLDLYGMVATKEGMEKIKINGKSYEAQKVKVTLQGFKKKFWKAEVWFDPSSHLLLKYKANEGPGTPMTETTLQTSLETAQKGF